MNTLLTHAKKHNFTHKSHIHNEVQLPKLIEMGQGGDMTSHCKVILNSQAPHLKVDAMTLLSSSFFMK